MGAGRKRPLGECVTFDLDATDGGVAVPMTITATRAGDCGADSTLECSPCAVPVEGGQTQWGRGYCILCSNHGVKKRAHFTGTCGKTNRLCAKHAKEMGTHKVKCPCIKCPPGAEKEANFNDKEGTPNKLCGTHSKIDKTSRSSGLCPDCPGKKSFGHYPGRPGGNRLCGPCAKIAGTYTVQNPCTKCPVPTQANFMDKSGRLNQLCAMHSREADAYQPRQNPKCANCPDTAYRRFSAAAGTLAGLYACLGCLVVLDALNPVARLRMREFKVISGVVHFIRTELGRPDIADAIQELGVNDCAEGPSMRRGDHVFRILMTLIGQIEVDEGNHVGYNTSCETAKVAGHIADRNGINQRSAMDSDADEIIAQVPLINIACHPDAQAQVVNTHVWRVDTTGAFRFNDVHRTWEPVEAVFAPLMLRVAKSIVAFVDSVTPNTSDTPAAAAATRAAVLNHPLWEAETFSARVR